MKKYKLAIVGATGLVGRTALKILEEKNIQNLEYTLFSSKKSAGTELKFMNTRYLVHELKDFSFDEHFDFAIFSAGAETSRHFAPIAASKGCVVIDNSSAFRMDDDVPLIVPEVNFNDVINHKNIIANPNCSTIQAIVALKPLDDKYKIKRIIYSTYQAVSGAGRNGVLDLENGIKNYMNDKLNIADNTNDIINLNNNHSYELIKFNYPIFSNCLPHIDDFLDNGYTKEEEKMINETKKILKNPELKITATTVRVPVFNSHSESINIEFEKNFEIEDLINTLSNSPGIIVEDDIKKSIYPLAINASGHDEVYVGRIRRDNSVKSGINLWVVTDNIRKGAATNAVQIIEKLLFLKTNQNYKNK